MPISPPCHLETASRKAGDFNLVIGCHVIAAALTVIDFDTTLRGKHGAAAHLPEDQNIRIAKNAGSDRRAMPQLRPAARRTQAEVSLKMISQMHQPVLALGTAGNADAVPVRPADSAHKDGVAGARHFQHLVRAECSVKIPGGTVEDAIIDFQRHLCLPGDPVEDTQALGQYFRANAVSAKCQYFRHEHDPALAG